MRLGKISENVLKRSVLKLIQTHREEVIKGAEQGSDCAFFSCPSQDDIVLTTDSVTYSKKNAGMLGVHRVANDIAAAGATPVGILVDILFSERDREAKLKDIMNQMEAVCAKLNMQIIGGHTEVTGAVNMPILTVTGVGILEKNKQLTAASVRAGQHIVMSKYIGMEGTVVLAKEHGEQLVQRLPQTFIDRAAALEQQLSVVPEAATAVKSNVSYMHDVSTGGIFGALWELAESAGVGLTIDLKAIPVKQETIEICEYFGYNPYTLISGGALLMVTSDGHELVKELEQDGIKATVIGTITDSNDRIIINGDERRYLDMPQPDEIYLSR